MAWGDFRFVAGTKNLPANQRSSCRWAAASRDESGRRFTGRLQSRNESELPVARPIIGFWIWVYWAGLSSNTACWATVGSIKKRAGPFRVPRET